MGITIDNKKTNHQMTTWDTICIIVFSSVDGGVVSGQQKNLSSNDYVGHSLHYCVLFC